MGDNEVIETRALAPQAEQPIMELSADDIVNRLAKIEDVQRRAMKEKIDYGVVPGTKGRPTLFKSGAEKLCVLFRLDPQFETTRIDHLDGHITVTSNCIIYHQVSGQRLGGASADCSSRESKYAYRKASRKCPSCGKETLIHTKRNPDDWWCNKYKDGCGANFGKDDPTVKDQQVGRVANEDVADQFPTVRRMAEKRALIAAVRLVTGASAIFDEPMEVHDDDPAVTPPDEPESPESDPGISFDQAHPPEDLSQAFRDEMEHHTTKKPEADGGIRATRIALIKKATAKLGEQMGIKWLTAATKDLGETSGRPNLTSEKLTIDDMLGLSERLTKLKPPREVQP